MGCDIHWHSETLKEGKWTCDQAATLTRETEDYGDGEQERVYMDDFPGRSRDYWFFGLLAAGVRSDWAWSFPYQDAIPDDLSPEVAELFKQWDADAHSSGTLTRAELMAKLEELKPIQAEMLISPPPADEAYKAQAPAHHIERLTKVIADMRELAPEAADDDHRIVFWFDH